MTTNDELREALRCAILRFETIQETHPHISLDGDLDYYRRVYAQGTEAQRAATTGAVEDDGPSPKGCAQNKSGGG